MSQLLHSIWKIFLANKDINQNHVSNATVNIPEARVLEMAREYFQNLPDSSAFTEAHSRAFERALLAHEATLEPKRRELEKDLRAKERTKADLLELLLDGTLDKATYRKKLSEIDTAIENAKAEIAKIDRFDRSKIEKLKNRIVELGNPLQEAYEGGSMQLRCAMLRNSFIELFITTKKELQFRENELFACLKCAFVSDGGPEEMANRIISSFAPIETRFDTILQVEQFGAGTWGLLKNASESATIENVRTR